MKPCLKCGHIGPGNKKRGEFVLCTVCVKFFPEDPQEQKEYLEEKIDWRVLDTFRKFKSSRKKEGMRKTAKKGYLVARPPLGYRYLHGSLILSEDAPKVTKIFSEYLKEGENLNRLSKKFNISANGLKKILSNRTYLGEIKFGGEIFKGQHKPLISPEIFYAVQRKLNSKPTCN